MRRRSSWSPARTSSSINLWNLSSKVGAVSSVGARGGLGAYLLWGCMGRTDEYPYEVGYEPAAASTWIVMWLAHQGRTVQGQGRQVAEVGR